MAPTFLVHHAARLGDVRPPSSLSGLAACLAVGARFVEVDINPLAGGDFALLHERFLEAGTDGKGTVAGVTADQVRELRLRWRDELTDERVATLSEAVALAAAAPALEELQLDLKAHGPVSDDALASLASLAAPLGPRVRVTSTADRALRRLQTTAPGLPIGFDPLRHLDLEPSPGKTASRYLCHAGAYGYLDDHPLAADRWGTPAEYLEARSVALWWLMPAPVWYIRATLLARMLEDGFDWIADLHRRGAQVAAWTLNPGQPHHLALARQLIARGVDRIITDDAPRLAEALGASVVL